MRVLSGGADLTIHAPPSVTTLVDVGRILDRNIEVGEDESIRIGAMTTLTDAMDHPVIAAHGTGVIPEMMVHVGNPLLRNFSTIGGHVARGKLSDVVPVLLALDAMVDLYTGADVSTTLADYYEQGLHQEPHIVTGLRLPALPDDSAVAFLRFARTAFDFPLLNICCRVDLAGPDTDEVAEVRIVLGATPRRSQRATDAEEIITTRGLTLEAIKSAADSAKEEVKTGGGWVASAEYRSHLVEVLTRRCLSNVALRLETA
jgi:CO/xanthine dehydrogenase FAD-binding subunit